MSLNLSDLTLYTNELTGLGKETILAANTIKGKGIIADVIYNALGDKYQFNTVSTIPYGRTRDCSTFTDTGSTVFTAEVIQLCGIEFPNKICITDLKKYYTDFYNEKSFNSEVIGTGEFADMIYENKMQAWALEVDKIIWGGIGSDSNPYAAKTGNYTLCTGILQHSYDLSGSVAANVARTAITEANAIVVVKSIVASVAANMPEVLDDWNLYLSPADFAMYLGAVTDQYKYNALLIDPASGIEYIKIPGTSGGKVVKVNGMVGEASGTFIATPKTNIGVVLSAEEDLQIRSWFDPSFDNYFMKLAVKFGAGVKQAGIVVRSQG